MMRFLRYVFIAVTGLVLLTLAVANRAPVTLRWLPEDLTLPLGLTGAVQMPLFLIILGAVTMGVLIGFVWEWFREMHIRTDARGKSRDLARLEREVAMLKDAKGEVAKGDDILALLDQGARR